MMKRFWLLGLLICFFAAVHGQSSEKIFYTRMEEKDCFGDLSGKGGVLILSEHNDLVITVTNARHPSVSLKGKQPDGYYAYEVVVDREETKEPKIEVSRRGDIFTVSFVAKTQSDLFLAYLVKSVQNPIEMQDLSRPNDAILDAKLAAVEITSSIADLQVDCPEALGATVKRETKETDNSLVVITVTLPIANLENAKKQCLDAQKEYAALEKRLVGGNAGDASDEEWERLDKLEMARDEAERRLNGMSRISVYGNGTNKLYIDLSPLKPRTKLCYGVLLLKKTEKVYVTECSAMMQEGARLFGLRKYDEARRSFVEALNAKDAPDNLKPSIATNIAQCDTCLLYERYAAMTLTRMQEKQKTNQADFVEYASAAMEFLDVLDRYNPCEYYRKRVDFLREKIAGLPLEMRFTVTKWVKDFSGFNEDGRLAGVEVWAYNGAADLQLTKSYKTDRGFEKMVGKSLDFKKMGVTQADGVMDLKLDRKNLPFGFFFRPIGVDGITTEYVKMDEVMRQSEGSYMKRQFRLRMYVDEE